MDRIDLVVFDMAGTTVQDDGQVPAAFTAALAEAGVPLTPGDVRAIRGASKRDAIRRLLPEEAVRAGAADAVYERFREHLATQFATTAREVPGAADVFAGLRGRGIRVALNTGFDRDTTQMLLAALHWETGVVDAVVCGDDVPQGRPAPYLIFRCMEATQVMSARGVAAVGDTVLDLQAGDNACVRWNVGVLSGAHSHEMLAAEPHTHLLASVAELLTVLSSA